MTKQAVDARRPRHLLNRLLDTPNLPEVVQSLDPTVLHQLVLHCGLEDCGEILALATTEQLVSIFDEDLWRSERIGEEATFDADRFGLWLEVLAEVGLATAAQKLVEMDFDFVTAGMSRHLLVLDQESMIECHIAADTELDDHDPTEHERTILTQLALEDSNCYDLGGFRVIAKRNESWDALVSILIHIENRHHGFFGRLMKRCSRLSTEYIVDNGGLYEVLTADEQVMADVAGDRELRREQEGYVTPSQAVAFLQLSRRGHDGEGKPSRRDPVTAGYFRELEHRAKARGDVQGSRADTRRIEDLRTSPTERRVADFLSTLRESGVIEKPRPPLLLEGSAGSGERLSTIRSQLRLVQERDGAAYARRTEELAYLANVLIAGCSFASRRFRALEAADAVLATCNLGLRNWRRPGAAVAALPPELLLHQDLVNVFRTGWSVLYEQVSLYVAGRLAEILSELRCDDSDVHEQLRELGHRMKKQVAAGTPWRAREDLDVIAVLDQPSWATLLGLLDECPVVPRPAGTTPKKQPLRVTMDFEFISENAQVAWIRDYVETLPGRLTEP
jgi:Family of unknown function (DUF6178)